MENPPYEPLLKIRRKFTDNEHYNQLLATYKKLQEDSKADTKNLSDLRRIHKKLEDDYIILERQLAGKGVVSEKKYRSLQERFDGLQKKYEDLKEQHYDLIRDNNRREAEQVKRELESLRM